MRPVCFSLPRIFLLLFRQSFFARTVLTKLPKSKQSRKSVKMAGVFTKCNGAMLADMVGQQVSVVGRVLTPATGGSQGVIEATVILFSHLEKTRLFGFLSSFVFVSFCARLYLQDGVKVTVDAQEERSWNTFVSR